jgi:phage I-like protein
MSELVSEDDLARARSDPAFRQQMMAENLERLLGALNKMRRENSDSAQAAAQIREGVDLAVKLADRLQQNGCEPPKVA